MSNCYFCGSTSDLYPVLDEKFICHACLSPEFHNVLGHRIIPYKIGDKVPTGLVVVNNSETVAHLQNSKTGFCTIVFIGNILESIMLDCCYIFSNNCVICDCTGTPEAIYGRDCKLYDCNFTTISSKKSVYIYRHLASNFNVIATDGVILEDFTGGDVTISANKCRVINSDIEHLNMQCEFTIINSSIGRVLTEYRGYVENSKIEGILRNGMYEPPGELCSICKKVVYSPEFRGIKNKKPVHRQCIGRYADVNLNHNVIGGRNKLPSFSFELEIERISVEKYENIIVDAVVEYSFIHDSDGTVDAEMKSPIYLDSIHLKQIKEFLDYSEECVGDSCGTHIHIGIAEDAKFFWLQNIGLFSELADSIDETSFLWGRDFCSYANKQYQGDRYCWINFRSEHPTVEYRLPKLRNAKQFEHLVQFCRVFTNYLEKLYREFTEQDKILSGGLLKRQYRSSTSGLLIRFYDKFVRLEEKRSK